MIDAEDLRRLGWSNELIGEVVRSASVLEATTVNLQQSEVANASNVAVSHEFRVDDTLQFTASTHIPRFR